MSAVGEEPRDRSHVWRYLAMASAAALLAALVCLFVVATSKSVDALSTVALVLAAISISMQILEYGYGKFKDLSDRGTATTTARNQASFEQKVLGELKRLRDSVARLESPGLATLARLPEALAGEELQARRRVTFKVEQIASEEAQLIGVTSAVEPRDVAAWKSGDRLQHPVWGGGEVVSVDSEGVLEVLFSRSDVGRRRLNPKFADLGKR